MTYEETINYLYTRLPMFSRIGEKAYNANLDKTIELCDELGNPERKFKSIHVAGTNGKGSTSHILAAILQSAGYKTGLYTSPHLKSFTERIRINGAGISEGFVIDFVEKHREITEKIQPSFFELTVAMMFDYFAKEKVDIAIIEVGLGGRLDSTNVIIPELSIITNISFDHQNILGDTLPKIAYEKAGIIKKNVPVVISERQPEVEEVFIEKAQAENSAIYFASDFYDVRLKGGQTENRAIEIWKKEPQLTPILENSTMDLTGDYQLKNVKGILQAVEILQNNGWGIFENNIKNGLQSATQLTGLKGRWQKIGEKPLTICDTGHNEGGITEILKQLSHTPYEKLYWIIGTVNDKDLSKILTLLPENAYYFFCEPHIPRKLPAEILYKNAQKVHLKGEIIPDVNDALAAARKKAGENDMILIAGSNFVVAEVNEL